MEHLTRDEVTLYNNSGTSELEKLKILNSMVDRLLVDRENGKHESSLDAKLHHQQQKSTYEQSNIKRVPVEAVAGEDHWGANKYLNSGFDFVNEYFAHADKLSTKTNSMKHVFASHKSSYQVVQSNNELFQTQKTETKVNMVSCEGRSVSDNDSDVESVKSTLQTHRPCTEPQNSELVVFSPETKTREIDELKTTIKKGHKKIPVYGEAENCKLRDEYSTPMHLTTAASTTAEDNLPVASHEHESVSVIPNIPEQSQSIPSIGESVTRVRKTEAPATLTKDSVPYSMGSLETKIAYHYHENKGNWGVHEQESTSKSLPTTPLPAVSNRIKRSTSRPQSATKSRKEIWTAGTIFNSANLDVRQNWLLKEKLMQKKRKEFCTLPLKDLSTNCIETTTHCTPHMMLLPDELILGIFSFLSIKDVASATAACKKFYRIGNDSSLWKVVTLQSCELKDKFLSGIGSRKPRGLELISCDGKKISNRGLRELFQNLKQSLEYLNMSKCSGDNLTGDTIMLHASTYCKHLNKVVIPWSSTTDNGLSSLSYGLKQLAHLNISGNSAITDEAFKVLLEQHGHNLKVLEVAGCFSLSSESFVQMAEKSTPNNLRKLNFGLCKVAEDTINLLCGKLPSLRHLDMHGIKSVTDLCIQTVTHQCKNIHTLVLSHCVSLSDQALFEMSENLPLLRNLNISGCCKVTDDGVSSITSALPCLQTLDISSTGVTHISVTAIAQFGLQWLTSLKLSFCHNITNECLYSLLTLCSSLEVLHLYGCRRIQFESLLKIRPGLSLKY
ncbi:uncharacterized protein LOC100185393 isoform X1 [Ciona intestinalis]